MRERAPPSPPADQRDRLRGQALASPGEPEPVRGRGPHGDAVGLDADGPGEARAHLVPVRSDARFLADEHAVGVHELPAGILDALVGDAEEVERRGALPLRLAGREERADVLQAGSAEQRVDERVREHVAVGVADEPARVLDPDTAEDERDAFGQDVRVDADPHPEVRHR